MSDLNLKPALEYTVAVSYEIRKQITLHCCRKLQTFTSYYENYVSQELEVLDQTNVDPHPEIIPPNVLFSATLNDEPDLEAKAEFMEEADLLQREQIFLNGKLSDQM